MSTMSDSVINFKHGCLKCLHCILCQVVLYIFILLSDYIFVQVLDLSDDVTRMKAELDRVAVGGDDQTDVEADCEEEAERVLVDLLITEQYEQAVAAIKKFR